MCSADLVDHFFSQLRVHRNPSNSSLFDDYIIFKFINSEPSIVRIGQDELANEPFFDKFVRSAVAGSMILVLAFLKTEHENSSTICVVIALDFELVELDTFELLVVEIHVSGRGWVRFKELRRLAKV